AHRAGRCGRMGRNGIVISLGGGGADNVRLQHFAQDLDFELFGANVNDGQLGVELDSQAPHLDQRRNDERKKRARLAREEHVAAMQGTSEM
ncbi:unnamed protein product, partial [Polarella glacialis]